MISLADPVPETAPDAGDGDCGMFDVACKGGELLSDAASGTFEELGEKLMTGYWSFVAEWLIGGWMKVDSTDLASSSAVQSVQSAVTPIAAIIMLVGICVAMGKVFLTHRGDGFVHLARSILVLTIVTGSGIFLIQTLLTFGDEFSDYMMEISTDDDFAMGMQKATTALMSQPWGPPMAFVIGFLGAASNALQAVIMIIRNSFLVVFAGMIPVLAAFTMSKWSESVFQRAVSWVLALIFLKPIASIIYATAFWTIGAYENEGDLRNMLAGAMLIILAVFTLPVLVRLFAPVTAAAVTAGSGAMAGGMAAAGMSVAHGSKVMSSAGGRSAGASASGAGGSQVMGSAGGAATASKGAAALGPVGAGVAVAGHAANTARNTITGSAKQAAGDG